MKKTLAALTFLFGISFFLRAQTTLTPVDGEPADGVYYSLQNNFPPTPFDPFPQLPLYTDGSSGNYYYDTSALETGIDNTQMHARAFQARRLLDGPPSPGNGDGSGGGSTNASYPIYSFDTNSALYLELVSVSTNAANLILHNIATNDGTHAYGIWSTTDLRSTWNMETVIWAWDTNCISFSVPMLDRTNSLFFHAEDFGVTNGSNTVPNWWLAANFGTNFLALADSTLDAAGIDDLLVDYQCSIDPNIVNFNLVVTNEFVNGANVPAQLNITGGVPYYMAVLIDDTNLADAVWQPYGSSNILVNLGSTEGWHGVWVGLSGLPSDAHQTWEYQRLKLDLTPPVLVIANPAVSTVSVPLVQVQGYCSKALRAITYDLTNALGLTTNQQILITDSAYDTNSFEFATNTFQGYDIPLAVGSNIITLHATDMAGNSVTFSTNIVLDYSSRTNPPVVNLYWPQNGTVICNSNYTWRGWVDDPSATVTAQLVDTDGDTNVYSAMVERNGNFWVQNLSLSRGTNWLTLTVTDSAGNVAVTNIIVTSSALALSIDPLSSDQLWNPTVTVTGTIGDSTDYTLWVNGIEAALNGDGTWTATNVYLPKGGTALIQARAIPNSDSGGNGTGGGGTATYDNLGNPASSQAQDYEEDVNRGYRLYVQSYTDCDNGSTGQTDSFTDAAGNPSESSFNGVQWESSTETGSLNGTWQDGGGGSSTWNWQGINSNNITNSTGIAYAIASYAATLYPAIATASLSVFPDDEDNPFNVNLEHCDIGTPVVDESGSYVNPPDGYEVAYDHQTLKETGTRHAQTTLAFDIGSPSSPDEQSVYLISLSATQIIPSKRSIPFWASPVPQIYAPVPYEDIAIGDFGNLDTNGNLYVKLPPDSTDDLTPRVDGMKYYVYGFPNVQKFTLSHLTGCTASGNPDNTRKTIGIGEVVAFSGLPDNTTWTLSGGGSISATSGGGITFTASLSPGSATITASVASVTLPVMLNVIAPAGIGNVTVLTNVGFGESGTVSIGADTEYRFTILPTSVNFSHAQIREDFSTSYTRHWPNGDTSVKLPGIVTFPAPSDCQVFDGDEIIDGPIPIGRLWNGTSYVDFSYTVDWEDEYLNASGDWVGFASMETVTKYRGSDQACQEIYQGVQGSWQGPWAASP